MTYTRFRQLGPVLAAMLLVPHAASANPSHARIITLRDIEFEVSRDDREAAGLAMLKAAVPVGTSLEDARQILHRRDARCRKPDANGNLRCSFPATDVIEERPQDILWKIAVTSHAGAVTGLSVDRTFRGG